METNEQIFCRGSMFAPLLIPMLSFVIKKAKSRVISLDTEYSN